MFGTYKENDVTILLKDITGLVEPLDTLTREKLIQSGVYYCEMLPIEYKPTEKYMEIYHFALLKYAKITADAVGRVAEQIWQDKGENTVLVSLARAGTPIGVLIKHYMEKRHHVVIPHYTISIIRGKGIDKNAMNHIISRHGKEYLQFIDGWTGKGAIKNVLKNALEDMEGIEPDLAVLSDPAYVAEKTGTHEDFLIASSCLNSTVSGLLSRTFLKEGIIEENDFHGAVFYKELLNEDVTYEFIDTIEKEYDYDKEYDTHNSDELSKAGYKEAVSIKEHFNISSINFVKPGIGEATRVLLRRVPWKILVHSLDDDHSLGQIYQLAKEKNVELEVYPLKNYKACGLIKDISDV